MKNYLMNKENGEKLIKTDKIESIDVFSGMIAHEFNNLLSGIQAWAQIGAKEKDKKNITKAFDNIAKACQSGTTLAKSLLDFSRRHELNVVSVNINKLIDETLDLLAIQFKNKNIIIEKNYSDINPIVVDKGKIYQVFLNILINAKDSIEKKEGFIKITTSQKEDFIQISFSDNGKGISPKNLKNIFKPFYTTKKVKEEGKTRGTGLGLAISKDIIRQHRGEIFVESKEGKGTDLHILLPLNNIQNQEKPEQDFSN
jgi:signal transduction histidine kinase